MSLSLLPVTVPGSPAGIGDMMVGEVTMGTFGEEKEMEKDGRVKGHCKWP